MSRRCQERLDHWGGVDGDLTTLVDRLADQRRRPIVLLPVRMRASHPSGFWLETASADIVGYEADTSPTHRQHIIAHELSHILCGHRNPVVVDGGGPAPFFPDLDPELVRSVLRRLTGYSDTQEYEAEIMAWLLVRDRCRPSAEPERRLPPDGVELVRRLEESFAMSINMSR